ncbi:uncharacterized protein PADG_11143 [Paracoccidioides brasiliensis Pb18]|uniref:Uncharacterized protein n=1 Tax=Paracoccidioides brasiliensis (strain Pb18) TaxID=502780 RepID=A0A0A0HX95_PARBD|nr:uncharacterized protein PADG_11143 [Paracoccidioides brasiliensis Pb18]KGM92686.1 hypothetical protein PADG_11143 [Paracoccidioides brasiliensis Pb18]
MLEEGTENRHHNDAGCDDDPPSRLFYDEESPVSICDLLSSEPMLPGMQASVEVPAVKARALNRAPEFLTTRAGATKRGI